MLVVSMPSLSAQNIQCPKMQKFALNYRNKNNVCYLVSVMLGNVDYNVSLGVYVYLFFK